MFLEGGEIVKSLMICELLICIQKNSMKLLAETRENVRVVNREKMWG